LRTDDYHQLLGVGRYASRESLRRAFRLRLFAVHPDRNPEDSLASERTREVIEAYHVLAGPPDSVPCESATLCTCEPRVVYRSARAVPFSNWAFRALTVLALLALMAWVVLSFIQEVFGGPALVFRPDPAALGSRAEVRAVPIIVEPGIHDCLEWYCTQQYQLSLAGDWAAREIVKAYEEAARRAELRRESVQVRFYRSAIDTIVRAQRATFL
jgi:hypothetical protein